MKTLFSLLAAALLASEARAECPEDPVQAARSGAAGLEASFVQADDAAFAAARAELDAALPCIAVPLEKLDVLVLHRAMALVLFVDGDMRGSQKSFAAVKFLRPDWTLSDAMAPEGHLLRQIFDQAVADPAVVTLDLAPVNGWLVDGSWTSDVPSERAFVLQALGEEGVYYTGYELSVAGVPVVDLVQPGPSPRMRRARAVGTGVAAALAAGSLGGLAVYLQARGALDKVPYQEVPDVATRGNVGGGVAIGLGTAAVATFTVAWAVPW